MLMAVIVMSCVTLFSLLVTSVAIYSAYRANRENSAIAEVFVNLAMHNGDKVEYVSNGEKVTSINFPNSEGFN